MNLTVSNLTCTRGGVPILEGVEFTLASGQALVLRGPNGSGKTTLLRTLAGLQPALEGTVESPDDGIAYAGHLDGIKSTLTVTENLAFWARVFGQRDIDAALRGFDLETLRDRAAQTLSAGQKRRLGLARLAVTGRPVWLLDEPTVSLDTASVALFAEALRGHLASGGSVLVATHIDLGFQADVLDVSRFKPSQTPRVADPFDEAFT